MIAMSSLERGSRISTLTISATKSGRITRTWAAISGSFHVSTETLGPGGERRQALHHWNSPAKWQATSCLGRNVRKGGGCSAQMAFAIGQRVRKRHPEGGSVALAGSPDSFSRDAVFCGPCSDGWAEIR